MSRLEISFFAINVALSKILFKIAFFFFFAFLAWICPRWSKITILSKILYQAKIFGKIDICILHKSAVVKNAILGKILDRANAKIFVFMKVTRFKNFAQNCIFDHRRHVKDENVNFSKNVGPNQDFAQNCHY